MRRTVKVTPHHYRAIVRGVVVQTVEVWPGEGHGPAWAEVHRAYDAAAGGA